MSIRQIFLLFGKKLIYTIAGEVEIDVLHEGLAHTTMLDSSWHEEENSGNKIKKIQNGAESYNQVIKIWVNNIIEICVNFVGISLIMFKIDHKISLAILFYIVVYYIISTSILKKARKKSHLMNIAQEKANGVLYENVYAIRTVKLLGIGKYLFSLYKQATDEILETYKKSVFWFQVRLTSSNIWTHIFYLTVIACISYGVLHGRYEIGLITLFYSYMGSIRESVGELAGISESIVLAGQKIERYEDFKKLPINTENEEHKTTFPLDWKEIRFENVSFSYKEQQVLCNINLTIKKGEKIGVVGLSGAGKSTLFKLLLKEREDYQGEIYVDDVSLKKISPSSYRSHIGVVLQDTEVFNMSLRDNVVMGQSGVNDDRLSAIIEVSHVKDFVEKLKEGMETLIGEKGIKLSGGERQRLGIARALYKNPEILFLDEATSHLDSESEEKIKDSLHKAFENITAVVIAHRLTTIKEMNTIIVIEDGNIIEQGTFKDLKNAGGRFTELWKKQT